MIARENFQTTPTLGQTAPIFERSATRFCPQKNER